MKKKITIYNKKTHNAYVVIFIEGYEQEILTKNIAMNIERVTEEEIENILGGEEK